MVLMKSILIILMLGGAIAACSESPKTADDLVPAESSAETYSEYLDETLEEVEYGQ
jgi:hypothetical protein